MLKIKKINIYNFGTLLFFITTLSFLIILFKIYELQILKPIYKNKNFSKLQIITPLRGDIYLTDKDGNLFLAATSYYLYDLYYYPSKAKNIEEEIKNIFKIINDQNLDNEKINQTISLAKNNSKSFILKKNISYKQKLELEKLKYDSIFFEEKVVRYYPLKDLLGTVIGFARMNEETRVLEGQYGLEKYYDNLLKGEIGYKDSFKIIKSSKKGNDIILNIDYYVQVKANEILKSAIKKFNAFGGLIIIAEVKTGNILAVAEYPNYDPNNFFKQRDYSIFISRLSTNYEPGSVMKPFVYAAAFEENLIKPEDTYEDKGYIYLNGWTIYNFDKKGRGKVNFKTALEQSLNTGSVYVAQILGKIRFLKYIEYFRLNKKVEVDYSILEEPNFKNLKNPGREVNFATASFGQGIALSPLNLIQSFNLFANNGNILKLNFVKKIKYFNNSYEEIKPKILTKVLTQNTIDKIVSILEGVPENQAKKAKIKGFRVAGKTGSALIPKAKETTLNAIGYSEEAITNFIGFFPVSDPKYIVLVRLDKPAQGLLAFGTAAPTFKEVAEFLINYYNLEPDKFEELTKEMINF